MRKELISLFKRNDIKLSEATVKQLQGISPTQSPRQSASLFKSNQTVPTSTNTLETQGNLMNKASGAKIVNSGTKVETERDQLVKNK